MLSMKGKEQIRNLKQDIISLERKKDNYYTKYRGASPDMKKYFNREITKIGNKVFSIEERIRQVEQFGLSTYEQGALKKELSSFKPLTYSRDLGSRDKVVVGYSKTLKSYVIVDYTRYTSFMGNVRGMGSLAGTKDIGSIKFISKQQYDSITKKPTNPPKRPTGWERRPSSKPDVLGMWNNGY